MSMDCIFSEGTVVEMSKFIFAISVADARRKSVIVFMSPLWYRQRRIVGVFFFFQAEDGIRDVAVTGVQTCALPIELSQLAIQSLSGYFRSHPLPSERLAQANRIIAQEHCESRTARKPFHVAYEVRNGEFVK